MDTVTRQAVEEKVELIKKSMPKTYKTIQQWAEEMGDRQGTVFARIRRGLAGKPNCFWAMEAGHVVGTPFQNHPVAQDVTYGVFVWGSHHVCVLGSIEEVQA